MPDLASQDLDTLAVNAIRLLSVDGVQKANSGHPGLPMGTAAMAYVIWQRHLRHNPADPSWVNRDRFVLSAGHGSMLVYSLLHLAGYDLPMEELKQFRQWDSKTPGHPENFMTPGVETTTGPLGQGLATGVGFGMAEAHLAATLNRDGHEIIDHYTYAIVSDGDLMEGVASEAASLAGHLQLGKLIYLYDDNEITIDGTTGIAFTEDRGKRFEAYGWHVTHVADGNDLEAIDAAINEAKAVTDKPSLIVCRTIIGYGSPNKADSSDAHGSPLGPDEVVLTKKNLGWPADKTFYVPDEVYAHFRTALDRGAEQQKAWNEQLDAYRAAYPDALATFDEWFSNDLPAGWKDAVPTFEAGKKVATRNASGKVLNAVAGVMGNLFGGSADLAKSNKTDLNGEHEFQPGAYDGRIIRFGVREHGMAAICNGLQQHGGLRAYCATFLVFSDYLRPSLRLSALTHTPVVYVFTHDSIGLGEDGPTHQPVEHFLALRSIPNVTFIRPADANETADAWIAALENTSGPTALALSRQNLMTFDPEVTKGGTQKGAYILSDSDGTPDVILMASGSEVEIIADAADTLRADGHAVRVVSVPSWELFDAQGADYREQILPKAVTKRLAVEAGVTLGWERYVGTEGAILGLDRFGASAPYEVLYEKFGFTPTNVAEQAKALLDR
ncbi:MAG: transketolase [Rhodothermales bacterium]